jgi:hypothetical protein
LKKKGINLGYGSLVFPGVYQGLFLGRQKILISFLNFFPPNNLAMIDANYTEAQQQITLLSEAILNAATFLIV